MGTGKAGKTHLKKDQEKVGYWLGKIKNNNIKKWKKNETCERILIF